MSQAIYKVWFMAYKEPWYKLTTEEQNKLMAKSEESLKQVGGELIMVRASVWSSEEWLAWGVEKFPDIEAVQTHVMNLFSANWFQYIDSKTYLGTEMPQAGKSGINNQEDSNCHCDEVFKKPGPGGISASVCNLWVFIDILTCKDGADVLGNPEEHECT